MKLLNPKTRMETPVNYTTLGKFELNSCASMGNVGAIAKGPKPWAKEKKVAEAVVMNFQNGFQFFKQNIKLADCDLALRCIAAESSYQWIVRVARRLWHQYAISCRHGRAKVSSVDHNLSTRNTLNLQDLLHFVQHLVEGNLVRYIWIITSRLHRH